MNKSHDSLIRIPESEVASPGIIWDFGRFAVSADGKMVDQTAKFERDLKMHLANVENGNSQDIEEPAYDDYLKMQQADFRDRYPVGSEIDLTTLVAGEPNLSGSDFVSNKIVSQGEERQHKPVIGNEASKLLKIQTTGEILYSFKGELIHPTYKDVYKINEKSGAELGQYDVFRPSNSNKIIYFLHKIELLIRCGDKLLYYLDTNNPQPGTGRTITLETLEDAIGKMTAVD